MTEELKKTIQHMILINQKFADDPDDHLSIKGKGFYEGYLYALKRVLELIP